MTNMTAHMTDTTLIDRYAVVTEARTWLGTPFHHQARLKGVGVDCVGLVIGVARSLGLVAPDFDVQPYARLPDGHSLMALATQHLQRLDVPAKAPTLQAGDVVVVSFDADPQHFGVLGDYRHGGLSLIHAHSISGRVIETRLMFSPTMKFVAAFALPGVV